MKRSARLLLPWFERREAITALLGFRLPLNEEEATSASREFDAALRLLNARDPHPDSPPEVEPLPSEIAEAGAGHLELMQNAGWSPGHSRDVRTGIVDLRNVIAFQKAVCLDGIGDRVASASADDWQSLADVCLPRADAADEEELRGTFDKNSRGMTISSLNPNLRASQVRPLGRTRGGQLFGVEIVFGTPFVHVVEYRGRLFLRDGYHRTHGLLARGIHRIPCLWERGASAADVHAGGSSFVGHEHLFGLRPPLLTDFHHPDYSRTVEQQSFRKVVRIHVEEFVVHV